MSQRYKIQIEFSSHDCYNIYDEKGSLFATIWHCKNDLEELFKIEWTSGIEDDQCEDFQSAVSHVIARMNPWIT